MSSMKSQALSATIEAVSLPNALMSRTLTRPRFDHEQSSGLHVGTLSSIGHRGSGTSKPLFCA